MNHAVEPCIYDNGAIAAAAAVVELNSDNGHIDPPIAHHLSASRFSMVQEEHRIMRYYSLHGVTLGKLPRSYVERHTRPEVHCGYNRYCPHRLIIPTLRYILAPKRLLNLTGNASGSS